MAGGSSCSEAGGPWWWWLGEAAGLEEWVKGVYARKVGR